MRLLLPHGPDLNATNYLGETPLHLAVQHNMVFPSPSAAHADI